MRVNGVNGVTFLDIPSSPARVSVFVDELLAGLGGTYLAPWDRAVNMLAANLAMAALLGQAGRIAYQHGWVDGIDADRCCSSGVDCACELAGPYPHLDDGL